MKLYTIGFTQKSAERFFGLLAEHGVEQVVDIRLKPGGQLSGFAKQDDLAWFLERLNGAGYVHLPQLAPSDEIRDDYRQDHDWERYVPRFEALMDDAGYPGRPRSGAVHGARQLPALQRAHPGALPPPPRRRAPGPRLAGCRGVHLG